METELSWDKSPEDLLDKFDSFEEELTDQLVLAMGDIVMKSERGAKHKVNVDTGRLRASIESYAQKLSKTLIEGFIGSNVYYAPFQEVIDPYLRPTIEENMQYAKQRVKEAVETAWENSS